MGLSKKQKQNAERLQAALDAADEQNVADALELAKAVKAGDAEKADEIAARLKRRGAY
ncbi:hypothetical protein [Actinoallomurus sp. CA-142502]|uniref:hypothetical protein n=1 Tax=Actinoallomurus sp. CA-142502 TaxID=3239885 RepID=UPI003D920641